jgi:tRNA dimethylallyltransferase
MKFVFDLQARNPVSGYFLYLWALKKLVVIVGPTASGKTGVAIQLAKHYRTEIISADSRQIYREMEIGTAKPTEEQRAEVRHHFINSHSIEENYDAGAYGRDAQVLIHSLFEKQDVLILCGGSGLYIKAVLEGFDDLPKVPAGIREKIVEQYRVHGISWLQQQLKALDPDYYGAVDIYNPQRLIRALELLAASGKPILTLRTKKKAELPYRVIKIGLAWEREQLYKRIDERMSNMIACGLFEEAKRFYPIRHLNALQTVGYREIFDYLDGQYDRNEAIRLLKRNSRRYAKRQLTWFKRDEEIHWFNPEQVEDMIQLIDMNN